MKRGLEVAAIVALVLLAVSSFAQVPEKMDYQVMLTNDLDEPLADQSVTMVFRIYDADTGGTLKWSETHSVTTNSIGVASVVLGSIGTIHSPDFVDALWLEVEVDSEILSPRRELVSAPYAFYAADSDALGGLDADDYVTGLELDTPGTINDGDNPVDWTKLKNVPAGLADGTDDTGGAGDGHSLDAVDGDPTDVVFVDVDGDVTIGGATSDGVAEFYADGGGSPQIELMTDGPSGGHIGLFEDNGDQYAWLEPDYNGPGGFLEIVDGDDYAALEVDGNFEGGGSGKITMRGSGSATYFQLWETGNDAVQLPVNAVSDVEILGEAGGVGTSSIAPLPLDGSVQNIAEKSIAVVAPGLVLAFGTIEPEINHAGTGGSASFAVSSTSGSMPGGGGTLVRIPANAGNGIWNPSLTVHGLFPVDTVDIHTFYLVAEGTLGTWTVGDRSLTLVYLPTSYEFKATSEVTPTSSPGLDRSPGQ